MRRLICSGVGFMVIVVSLLAVGLLPVQAAPVIYTFAGTCSGELNYTHFDPTAFTVEISGNTDNIIHPAGPDVPQIDNLCGTIAISGVGTGSFMLPLYVYTDQTGENVGFGEIVGGALPYLDLIDLFVSGAGLSSYCLGAPFGPITDPSPYCSKFEDIALNIGYLTLDLNGVVDTTFTAVPLPPSLLLFGFGLVGLCGPALRARLRK